MIAKPMGLASLNQFPQRAERMIPFGATHQGAMPRPQMAPVHAPSMGGLHSLAPRFSPPAFRMPAGFSPAGMKRY